MALNAHEKAHKERIEACYDRVKAKADAGHEGCKVRLTEYNAQLAKYTEKAGG